MVDSPTISEYEEEAPQTVPAAALERRAIRLSLLLFVGAAVWLFFSIDPEVGLAVYGGPRGQVQAWSSVSRPRVFAALHCLFGSLAALLVAWCGVFQFWYPARRFLWAATVGLFAYYRLDPRFQAEEWWYLGRAFITLLLGAGSYFAVLRWTASVHIRGGWLWRFALLCAAWLFVTVLGSIFTSGEIFAGSKELALSALLFLVGVLSVAAGREPYREESERRALNAMQQQSSLRAAVISFALHIGLGMVVCFFLVEATFLRRLLWALGSPLVPAAAGVYAAYTWFLIPGPPQVFTGGGAADVASEQARLYLGIAFQYLTLAAGSSIWAALGGRRLAWLVIAHLLLLLYWLPAFWLMTQVGPTSIRM